MASGTDLTTDEHRRLIGDRMLPQHECRPGGKQHSKCRTANGHCNAEEWQVLPLPSGLTQVSKANTRFQSFFMLITVQPCFFAWSYNAWGKAPIFVSGSPCAGPYAYS